MLWLLPPCGHFQLFERELRAEAAQLSSLVYFRPQYMSLVKTHPVWSSAGSSPSKVTMATVQAQMLSGRYRTESLCSKWKPECTGVCLLSPLCSSTPEDLKHILQDCIALIPTRQNLLVFTRRYCENFPDMSSLVFYFLDPSNPEYCQFLIAGSKKDSHRGTSDAKEGFCSIGRFSKK